MNSAEIDLFAPPELRAALEPPPVPVVLAFLQNTWVNDVPRCEQILSGLSRTDQRKITAAWLFMGCLTGRRLQRAFGEMTDEIVWENASPKLAGHSSGSFPPDPEHIRATLEEVKPSVVLIFGKVAERGVLPLWKGRSIIGPHPTARGGDVVPALERMAAQLNHFIGSTVR